MSNIIFLKNKIVPIDPYEVEFSKSNWNTEFFPILEHESVDEDGLLQYLKSEEFHSTDGIIITSQRAVEALNSKLINLAESDKRILLDKPIYTVGPATSKVLKQAYYSDIRGGNQAGNGDILSDLIIKQFKESPTPLSKFVFFTGETRRDIIPIKINQTNGMKLVEKIVYKTKPLDELRKKFEKRIASINDNEYPWVVFFSPSNTEDIIDILKVTPDKFRLAAIGPTTEKYLKLNSLPPDAIAEKPDAIHLLRSINNT